MIDLMNKTLPNAIEVGGEVFAIHTDFRIWMQFCDCFEKWDKKGTLDISFLFVNELPIFHSISDYDSILNFAYPKSELPRVEPSGERMLDYVLDADYIYSAFMQQYGIDLLDVDMHWHKFKALLGGISEGTKLHEIMGYRSYTGEKIKTEEEKQAEEEFNDYFG